MHLASDTSVRVHDGVIMRNRRKGIYNAQKKKEKVHNKSKVRVHGISQVFIAYMLSVRVCEIEYSFDSLGYLERPHDVLPGLLGVVAEIGSVWRARLRSRRSR